MMAIGLVLFCIGFCYASGVYSPFSSNETVAGLFGWALVIGFALMVSSAAIWMWKEFP